MAGQIVRILDGNTFVVSDERGDIEASPTDPTGLFSFDTRFLSTWVLTVNGERLNALSIDDLQYFEARFFLVPGTGTVYIDAKLSVIRQRAVGDGFHEELTILNHSDEPVDLDRPHRRGERLRRPVRDQGRPQEGGHLRHARRGRPAASSATSARRSRRETTISSSEPAGVDEHGLTFTITIEPHGSWTTDLDVVTAHAGAGGSAYARPKYERGRKHGHDRTWSAASTTGSTTRRASSATGSRSRPIYRRSLVDLAALRFSPPVAGGQSLPAAGLPWFMTMFGRDSIFTSLQSLPFAPELAATTLRVLGDWQGSRLDDFRDEDPGRILHEMRYGEMAAFEERPHSPYYGSVDATPLYVDPARRVRALDRRPEARPRPRVRGAGRAQLDRRSTPTCMGNGYISYKRRNEQTGLENQGWKDSWNSISYSDGRLPDFPRATCELQGYAYDAKMRGARLARLVWKDEAYAERLETEAADLKRRFNRDFWLAERGYYALALDADGTQVDSLASNIGHLLWSGIVDDVQGEGGRRTT